MIWSFFDFLKNSLVTFLLLLLHFCVFAEGTKELRPTESSKGNLLLLRTYTLFGQYGAPATHQLKLRVADLNEKIYFGLNNKNGTDARGFKNDQGVFVPDIPFRILSPSGDTVYKSVIPNVGIPGNIPTWAQAVAGPKQLGNAMGYDAIILPPLREIGDYVIEFDPKAKNIDRLNINLFDFTVAGPDQKAIPARLHSQSWQISTESYLNPFNGKVYPYDGNSAVYEVDFNGIQPFVFTINFNSKGTANTGDFMKDRKSLVGNHTYPEFEVFLNPPDETLYPVQKREISIAAEAQKKDCNRSEFCLNFSTTSPGFLDAFVDLNMNGEYDPQNNEVYFSQYIDKPGTTCIKWDGKDSQGKFVPTGKFQVTGTLGFAPIHLPLYDVEHNTKGYKINIIRPTGATAPKIFWDDSNLTEGSVIDTKTNFTGCFSSLDGCHRWSNRGSIKDASQINKQETINTWWYSSLVNQTTVYSNIHSQQVRLSCHPTLLNKKDTTVCKGDSLPFYIYNDGSDHYNATKYTYEWFFNNQIVAGENRMQKKQINNSSEIIIKATDESGACISYDTLRVLVVDKVTIKSLVVQPPCDQVKGSINVEMITGPPNKQFYWKEFTTEKSGILNNLPRGIYHLTAKDPAYPHCGVDTIYNLREIDGISIDTVKVTSTKCNLAEGKAQVFMKNPAKNYEYSFDGLAYTKTDAITGLSAGKHNVIARELLTGCSDSRPFEIVTPPLALTIKTENEICNNRKGKIQVLSGSQVLKITWKDGNKSGVLRDKLSAGKYGFSVHDPNQPLCKADSAATILNSTYTITGDFSYQAISDSGGQKLLQFKNLSEISYKNKWSLGDGSTSELRDPLHSYYNDREYNVLLQLSDSNGCKGEVKKSFFPMRLSVEICGINLPNAFSPNAEGLNNDIGILGYAPFVELKIFNRWGEIIFRTFSIEKRWDGNYRNMEVPIGVYPYILDWICPDSNGNEIKYQKVGDISLIR